jgi:hypothetical protein
MVVGLCDSFLSLLLPWGSSLLTVGVFPSVGVRFIHGRVFLSLGFLVPWAILVLGAYLAAFYIPNFRLHVSAY